MEPDPRRAIVERREQIAAEPRPTPAVAVRIADIRETDDIYRLYRPEWVIVYTTTKALTDVLADLLTRCEQVFEERYKDRVDKDGVGYEFENASQPHAMCRLLLKLPNLKGEFKYAFLAERFADEQGYSDHTIVVRNSKADHDLRQYGIKKLAS